MGRGIIATFLTEAENHYQQLLKVDAATAARQNGFELQLEFCRLGVARQIQQLTRAVRQPAESRPRAIVVMPAQEGTLKEPAREAGRAGLAWVVLNRRAAFLERLPEEFPAVPMFTVTPNDIEIGQIQGRQLRALLPGGGRALLIRGGSGTSTTTERDAGLRSVLAGARIDLDVLYASWTREGAKRALDVYLRTPGRAEYRLDAVVGQSDDIALGAIEALHEAAQRLGRPELARTLILGCDGLPDVGQALVRDGHFNTTVIVPPTTGPAIDVLARVLTTGSPPPTEVLLPCAPFPP